MTGETQAKDAIRTAKDAIKAAKNAHRSALAAAAAKHSETTVGDTVLVYSRGAWRPAQVTWVGPDGWIRASRNGTTPRKYAWFQWARS